MKVPTRLNGVWELNYLANIINEMDELWQCFRNCSIAIKVLGHHDPYLQTVNLFRHTSINFHPSIHLFQSSSVCFHGLRLGRENGMFLVVLFFIETGWLSFLHYCASLPSTASHSLSLNRKPFVFTSPSVSSSLSLPLSLLNLQIYTPS